MVIEEGEWKKEAGEKMTEKCQKLRDQRKFQNEKKGANHFNCSFFFGALQRMDLPVVFDAQSVQIERGEF